MRHRHQHIHTHKIEKVGFYLSLICAIHCIATPLFITLLPYIGGQLFSNHEWEIWFISGSLILAGVILYIDYLKHHNTLPLLLLLGSLLVKLIEIIWLGHSFEFVTGTLGALLIAIAYYMNWKYKSACDC